MGKIEIFTLNLIERKEILKSSFIEPLRAVFLSFEVKISENTGAE
jgi:hypothetical protein